MVLDRIDHTLYAIKKFKMAEFDNLFYQKRYGYPYSEGENLKKLSLYEGVLFRHFLNLSRGSHCLCEKFIQLILEKVSNILGKDCCRDVPDSSTIYFREYRQDILFDRSGYNNWILLNPEAIPRERYEKLAHELISELNFSVSDEEMSCKLAFELVSNRINPVVTAALYVIKKACTLGMNLSSLKLKTRPTPRFSNNPVICILDSNIEVIREKCDTDYNILNAEKSCEIKSQVNNDEIDCEFYYEAFTQEFECDLTLEIYTNLIDCNFSPEIISTIYSCGLQLSYDTEKQCALIITDGAVISIEDLSFTDLPEYQNSVALFAGDACGNKEMHDIQQFIKRLSEDYD